MRLTKEQIVYCTWRQSNICLDSWGWNDRKEIFLPLQCMGSYLLHPVLHYPPHTECCSDVILHRNLCCHRGLGESGMPEWRRRQEGREGRKKGESDGEDEEWERWRGRRRGRKREIRKCGTERGGIFHTWAVKDILFTEGDQFPSNQSMHPLKSTCHSKCIATSTPSLQRCKDRHPCVLTCYLYQNKLPEVLIQ